ncbi:MAG: M16 family metallopeptidase [Nitrososphaerales archaeon]
MSSTFQLASGIEELQLENGLKVLLKPVSSSNAISTFVFYRVGSRNERPGITGSSHWCEHMMFKGGGKLGKGDVHTLVSTEGGRNNAFTDQDLTAYFETLPKEKLELALFIESERMTNSSFRPEEVASERQVIISEREGSENYPSYLLREEVFSMAFRVHPYRWPVVGWKSDLQNMTRGDLYEHYRKYYHPNNALLVVCGNFDLREGADLARKYFSDIKPGNETPPREIGLIEPEQNGERNSKLVRPGTLNYVAAGFHLPSILHEDMPALIVMTTVLGGWRGLIGFSADRYVPRSNRLYRKLVSGKIVSDVNVYFPVNIDPGLLYFDLTVLPGVALEKAKIALLSELDALGDTLPTEKEMQVAFNQIKSWHAYENDGVGLQAQSIGLMEIMGRRSLADDLISRALTVTPERVSAVARKYLPEKNRTSSTYESRA